MKTKESRHGLHKDGNVLLGAMVEPKKKAIALVTAAVMAGSGKPITQSDFIWRGVCNLAFSAGVTDKDGNVLPKYEDAVTLAEASVVAVNKSNRGSRGGKRRAK